MISQTVRISKLSTDDGSFKFKDGTKIGMETWIVPALIVKRKFGPQAGKFYAALAEQPKNYIPVEVLEFTSEFSET